MNASPSSGTRPFDLADDIKKVVGLDLLRVLREAERVSAKLPGASEQEKAPAKAGKDQRTNERSGTFDFHSRKSRSGPFRPPKLILVSTFFNIFVTEWTATL